MKSSYSETSINALYKNRKEESRQPVRTPTNFSPLSAAVTTNATPVTRKETNESFMNMQKLLSIEKKLDHKVKNNNINFIENFHNP